MDIKFFVLASLPPQDIWAWSFLRVCELQCLKTSPGISQCARSKNKFGPKDDTSTKVRGICFGDRNTGLFEMIVGVLTTCHKQYT